MIGIKKILIGFVLTCALMLRLFAEDIRFNVWTDTNKILIGDHLQLSIEAKATSSVNLVFPALKDSLGKFEILQISKIDTLIEGQSRKLSQRLILTTFDTGFVLIPSLTLLYEKKGVTGLIGIKSDSILIKVASIPVDTTKDIKDIKNILDVPLSIWDYLIYFAAILLIGGIAYGIYYFAKRRKRKEIDKPELKIPPHIWAIQELKRLDEEKLWQKGAVKEFHIRLNEIVRIYIERQLKILALEMISSEIIEAISTRNMIPNDLLQRMKRSFEISDMVKFAKYIPIPDENTYCFKIAFELIEATKPAEVPSPTESQTTTEAKK